MLQQQQAEEKAKKGLLQRATRTNARVAEAAEAKKKANLEAAAKVRLQLRWCRKQNRIAGESGARSQSSRAPSSSGRAQRAASSADHYANFACCIRRFACIATA